MRKEYATKRNGIIEEPNWDRLNFLTKYMIEHYMELRGEGLKNKQIASKCNVSTYTLYHYIPYIAKINGVTPDELLDRKSTSHMVLNQSSRAIAIPDRSEVLKSFDDSIAAANDIIERIGAILEELEDLCLN